MCASWLNRPAACLKDGEAGGGWVEKTDGGHECLGTLGLACLPAAFDAPSPYLPPRCANLRPLPTGRSTCTRTA